jgi:hypothetical protein
VIEESVVISALDAIERREARSIAWGLLEHSLSRFELEEIVEATTTEDPRDVVDELLRRVLVIEIPRSFPQRYRSRMAEGVRLFAALRQQFESRPWREAPRLISDFRFLTRPRRFPRRVLELDDVENDLAGLHLQDKGLRALRALLSDGGGSHRKLSRFQVDSAREILEGLTKNGDQARIVTAGTGSGKTLAFYLPTLVNLVSDPQQGKCTRVLAVYPRNELLKDQLVATLREVRKLRALEPSLPRIRIGAFFGPTPYQPDAQSLSRSKDWKKFGGGAGYVCPFLVCPGVPGGAECGKRLIWRTEDLNSAVERLRCESCEAVVDETEYALTRNQMQSRPPDILFTSTEMLNRSMSSSWFGHVFGVGPRAAVPPRMVLLDEAHTYTGASGAQTAYVLRRWRHRVGRPVMWAGLSATLRDAEQFFAKLTGVSPDFTKEITPNPEDLIEKGHEYQLLLRGDPTSQTALLSASIQSLMLLLRLLDPLDRANPSDGILGNKVFAFCDNLDLANRLFRQILDAEGRTPVGKVNPEQRGSLALLRSETHHPAGSKIEDWPARERDGQQWWLADALRESAVPPEIGRTSSQDSGVDSDAEIVIATASLEVGFDDPTVGAVLQHKAPRDLAQFLQRRGRAGRSQSMRPWTTVVLSDYGRDRLAYQSYERLFDPELPPKTLPIGNRSIERMQATFAVMDWVAIQLGEPPNLRGSVREDLTKPGTGVKATRQSKVAEILQDVLDNEARLSELKRHLCDALRLDSDEVDALLWEGPRSVVLEAIPTALRRLQSGWQIVRDGEIIPGGDRVRNDPLPEFVPPNLFSDLCLPEVQIVAPEGYDEAADKTEAAYLALREFAPGNVTLRYAVWKVKGLWIDPGDGGRLDIADSLLFDADVIDSVEDGTGRVDVHRPFSIAAEVPPALVGASSSGRLKWNSRFTPISSSMRMELPEVSDWRKIITSVDAYLHAGLGGMRLLRFSRGGTASLTGRQGRKRIAYEFTNRGEPTAIGVETDVDAIRFTVTPPENVDEFDLASDGVRLRQLRRDFFLWSLVERSEDEGTLNPFLATRLGELVVAASAHAVLDSPGTDFSDWPAPQRIDRVLEAFDRGFQTEVADDEPPMRDAVIGALEDEEILDLITTVWRESKGDPHDGWYVWTRRRFLETIAAAIQVGVQALLPDFDADSDLAFDIVDSGDGEAEVFASDVPVGGGGLVESFYEEYMRDPRRFWSLVRGALDPTDAESTAADLRRVIDGLVDGRFANSARVYRETEESAAALVQWRNFIRELSQGGIPSSHSLSVACATRILRPASSPSSDHFIQWALDSWASFEEQCGFALDVGTAASVLADDPDARDRLLQVVEPVNEAAVGWTRGVLLELLWSSPEAMRAPTLQASISFAPRLASTERTLVLDALGDSMHVVDVAEPDWREKFDDILSTYGRGALEVSVGDQSKLRAAVLNVMTNPVEIGALFLHPRVVALKRSAMSTVASFELPEAPQ